MSVTCARFLDANNFLGEMKVLSTVDDDTAALVDGTETKRERISFQPNPFWGEKSHAHHVNR